MTTITLLFPGQGAFYGGVLQDTRIFYPGVQRILDRVEAVVLARWQRSLTAAMWHPNSSAEMLLKTDSALLQLAIFTVSVASFEILSAEGIEPNALVGHSLGEIAALTCAGVYTLEQGAHIVCDRVEALRDFAPDDGRMASISAKGEVVQALLSHCNESRDAPFTASNQLCIAVENHDGQTVVSGHRLDIDRFMALCTEQGISNQLLNAPYAFHHPALAKAEANFARRLAVYPTAAPRCPVYSPILGRFYQDGDRFGELIAHHLVMPVQFSKAVRQLNAQGLDLFMEAGALNALSKIVIRILGPGKVKVFPTLEKQEGELASIRAIIHHLHKDLAMNAPQNIELSITELSEISDSSEFEAYWNQCSPRLMGHIKAEFLGLFAAQQAQRATAIKAAPTTPTATVMHVVAPAKAPATLPRSTLFSQLVAIYAEAMEYPAEVFSESVELEAELGIDSVKQTEIIGRIRNQYNLPPLPANFRSGDFKTMGQIVDFVFSQQGQALTAA